MARGFVSEAMKEVETTAGRFVLEIDKSGLLAALSLYPNKSGAPFFDEEIIEALKKFRVTRGIESEAIEDAIATAEATGKPVEQAIIAKGRAPVPSEDAYLEYPCLDALPRAEIGDRTPEEICRRKIVNIHEGDEIAIFHPLVDGTPGLTVRDQTIGVERGVDATARPGMNLAREENTFYSKVNGRLVIAENSFYVDPELRFDGDLTVVHGDIDFIGRIVVGGNIEAGVNVKCARNIEVAGTVVGSNIYCEGDLRIKHGLIGSDETTVVVLGNLEAAFIENANVRVAGDCVVRDSYATSILCCSKIFRMAGGRGHLVSGLVAARKGIEVQMVGVPVGTKARLCVGRDILAEENRQALEQEIKRLEASLKELCEIDRTMGPSTGQFLALTSAKRAEVEEMVGKIPDVERQIGEVKAKVNELQPRLVPSENAMVIVHRETHLDTIIEFPLKRRKVDTVLKGVRFRFNSSNSRIEMASAAAA